MDAFLICEQLYWGTLDLKVCQSSEVDTWKNLFLVTPKGFQELRLGVVPLQHAMLKRLPDRQSVRWLRGELPMARNGFISFTVGCFFLLKVNPHSLHSAKLSLVSKSVKGLSQHAAEWLRPHEHGNSWIRRGRDGLALRTSGSRMKTVLIYQYILSISWYKLMSLSFVKWSKLG